MEEILASIRRIIADDQPQKPEARSAAPEPEPASFAPQPSFSPPPAPSFSPPPAPSFSPPPEPAPPPTPIEDDILDLEDEPLEEMEVDDIIFADPPPAPVPPPRPAAQSIAASAPPTPAAIDPDALLSAQTDKAVGHAFQTLAGSILAGSQRTLDDIVREMLRPMLKEWLDDNLPSIVERLVRAEIERVARGGR